MTSILAGVVVYLAASYIIGPVIYWLSEDDPTGMMQLYLVVLPPITLPLFGVAWIRGQIPRR